MNAINYSTLRKNLATVMDECCDDHEPVIVTRKDKDRQVVIMSKEDYDSWMETFHVFRTHDMVKLMRSINQADKGQGTERQLLDD